MWNNTVLGDTRAVLDYYFLCSDRFLILIYLIFSSSLVPQGGIACKGVGNTFKILTPFPMRNNPCPLVYWVSFLSFTLMLTAPPLCLLPFVAQSFSVVFPSLPILYLVECFPVVIPDHCFKCYMYLCFTNFFFCHFSLCFSITTLSGRNYRTFSWKVSLFPVNFSYIRNALFFSFLFFMHSVFNSYW